jgi:hypothetical protein
VKRAENYLAVCLTLLFKAFLIAIIMNEYRIAKETVCWKLEKQAKQRVSPFMAELELLYIVGLVRLASRRPPTYSASQGTSP